MAVPMTSIPGYPPTRWLWTAAGVIALLAIGRLWWLPAHASLNVNEGWNAGHALRLFGEGSLYPPPDALVANNYPPLSFVIVGGIGKVIGDPILAGRLVSLAATLVTGAAVWQIVRRLADPRWATAGAVFFAGFVVTLSRKYLAINDPQWLGQAFASWALVLLIPAERRRPSAGTIIWAAALVVSSGLVKHNLYAVPVAVTIWLAIFDRRALMVWAAAGATFAAAACTALYAIWGTTVFLDILGAARSYSILRMAAHGGPLLLAVLPGLLAGMPVFKAFRHDPRLALLTLMLAVAIPTALIQRSGEGVGINATFETIFALAIAVAVGCGRRGEEGRRWIGVAALPALTMVPVAAVWNVHELASRDAAVMSWEPMIARLAATPGLVACEDQSLCRRAGRQSALDFFAVKQRLLQGRIPMFQAALDRGDFKLIAMRSQNPDWHDNRIIPAIRARYRTIYTVNDSELLVPR